MRHAHHSSLSPSFLYSQHFLALWRCRCFCQNRWGPRKVHRNFHHGVQSQTAKCRVMVFKVKQHRERNLGTSTSATDLDKSEAFSCGNTRCILDAKEERDKSRGTLIRRWRPFFLNKMRADVVHSTVGQQSALFAIVQDLHDGAAAPLKRRRPCQVGPNQRKSRELTRLGICIVRVSDSFLSYFALAQERFC